MCYLEGPSVNAELTATLHRPLIKLFANERRKVKPKEVLGNLRG